MLALATLNWGRPTVAEDGGLQWTTQHWTCNMKRMSVGSHSERTLFASETQLRINWHFRMTYSTLENLSVLMEEQKELWWTHPSCKPPFISIICTHVHLLASFCLWLLPSAAVVLANHILYPLLPHTHNRQSEGLVHLRNNRVEWFEQLTHSRQREAATCCKVGSMYLSWCRAEGAVDGLMP